MGINIFMLAVTFCSWGFFFLSLSHEGVAQNFQHNGRKTNKQKSKTKKKTHTHKITVKPQYFDAAQCKLWENLNFDKIFVALPHSAKCKQNWRDRKLCWSIDLSMVTIFLFLFHNLSQSNSRSKQSRNACYFN